MATTSYFFDDVKQSFADVQAEASQGDAIDTAKFLAASEEVVRLFGMAVCSAQWPVEGWNCIMRATDY